MKRFNKDIKTGLTKSEVKYQIDSGNVNKDTTIPTKSISTIILSNIFTLFNMLNLSLGIIVFLTGSYKNLLFLGTVITNTIISIVQELKKLNYTLDIIRQNVNLVDYKLINNIRKKIEYKELELENTCRRLHLNIKEYYTPVSENTEDVKMVNIK